MKPMHLLFTATAVLAIWNAALIWMTQVLSYPLWPFVDPAHFHDYHLAWWHRVWWTFLTAGLAFAGSVLLLFRRPGYFSRRAALVAVLAQVVSLIATLLYWAPLQASLATNAGLDPAGFATLMWTHWFRVGLIWIPAIVMTGYADAVLERDARQLGAEFLVKPITHEQVLAMIERQLPSPPASRERRWRRKRLATALPTRVNRLRAQLLHVDALDRVQEHGRTADQLLRVRRDAVHEAHALRRAALALGIRAVERHPQHLLGEARDLRLHDAHRSMANRANRPQRRVHTRSVHLAG